MIFLIDAIAMLILYWLFRLPGSVVSLRASICLVQEALSHTHCADGSSAIAINTAYTVPKISKGSLFNLRIMGMLLQPRHEPQ